VQDDRLEEDMRRDVPVRRISAALAGLLVGVALAVAFSGSAAAASTSSSKHAALGALDCNGFSTVQQSIKPTGVCTDIRGFAKETANTEDGRFYDNGHYIGHDEPDLTFLSNRPGSGNDVTWTETLPHDPAAAPTVGTPGSDVTHWFELSVAPWFSMALCNPNSYPQAACKPMSDANAPHGRNQGGGSSFLEVQFYPPGEAPFFDNISCDNSHWCASLHINDLECTVGFQKCNTACEEPTNFAFIQKNGVPTGPAGPQVATFASVTPNNQTLLMNPGDKLKVHIFDAALTGGGHALEVDVNDMTTGESGFMQASAANGYMATKMGNCKGIPFNYEPEYSTAKQANIVPWAALQTDISTQFEIGHWTPCSSLSDLSTNFGLDFITAGDPFFLTCNGPYEATSDSASDNPEGFGGDAFCYPAGDTHAALNQFGIVSDPNTMTGCLDLLSGGDIDFDGTSYWADWPTGTSPTATTPGSFVQAAPTSNGQKYEQSFFQTDVALSESTCGADISGCTVPPAGPGSFYPYWSTITNGNDCSIVFGNVASGPGVNNYGGFAQYGADLRPFIGYDEFESTPRAAIC
jgi:hypothetical protein